MEWPSPSSDASCNLHCHREIVLVSFVFQCQKQERLQRRSSHREVPTHLIRWVFSCRIYRALPACFLFTYPASQDMSVIKNFERHFTFVFPNIVHIILKFCPRKCFRYQIIDVETQPRLSDWVTDIPGELPLSISNHFQTLLNITLKNRPAIYHSLTNIKSIVFIFHANMGGKQCYRQRATRNKLKSFDVWKSVVSPTHREAREVLSF